MGNAVVRNRARRRLRELARQILPAHAAPGHDFVLVARAATAERPWAELLGDLAAALKRLGLWRDSPNDGRRVTPANGPDDDSRAAGAGA